MASLIDIRRRLRSVKSTQQITKAMKMVAAAKLRRAQDRVVGARPYAKLLSEVLASVAAHSGEVTHPLLAVREEKRVVVLVVAGDRGLAGAFNTNVNRATAVLLAAHPEWTDVRLLPIGKKAVEFWRRRKYTFTEKTYSGIFAGLSYAHAKEIASFLAQEFLEDRIDAAYIVVNEFRSILSQVVRTTKLPALARSGASDRRQGIAHGLPLRARRSDHPRLALAAVSRVHRLPSARRIGCGRDGGAHDGHGLGFEKRGRTHRQTDTDLQPRPASSYYQGAHRNRLRRRGAGMRSL